jgi:hypothetical protein
METNYNPEPNHTEQTKALVRKLKSLVSEMDATIQLYEMQTAVPPIPVADLKKVVKIAINIREKVKADKPQALPSAYGHSK